MLERQQQRPTFGWNHCAYVMCKELMASTSMDHINCYIMLLFKYIDFFKMLWWNASSVTMVLMSYRFFFSFSISFNSCSSRSHCRVQSQVKWTKESSVYGFCITIQSYSVRSSWFCAVGKVEQFILLFTVKYPQLKICDYKNWMNFMAKLKSTTRYT